MLHDHTRFPRFTRSNLCDVTQQENTEVMKGHEGSYFSGFFQREYFGGVLSSVLCDCRFEVKLLAFTSRIT